MPAIRSPEASLRCDHRDDGVEKTPGFVDNVSEPFVVSIGEISLEGRGLDGVNRKNAKQYRLSRDVILIIVPPFASRDLVFATNQGAVAPIRERSLP